MRFAPPIKGVALAAIVVLILGCVTNPETGSSGLVLVPDSMMNSLGAQAYAEVLQKERVSSDARLRAIVERVSRRIATASGVDFDWEFNLVESDQANAFCLPGGKIVVYTGILPYCETEAGLAFVVGHEVGHAVAKHGAQRVSQNLIKEAGLAVSDLALEGSAYHDEIMGALGVGSQLGVLLPFSRFHESEADHMGLIYMARAGYDPAAADGFWPRMSRAGQQPPEFLSTHPSHATRQREIERLLPEAKRIYEQQPVKYGMGERLL